MVTRNVDGNLYTESHVYFSPDLKHDTALQAHCLEKVLKHYIAEKNGGYKKIFIWSDGAPSQYKNRFNFWYLAHKGQEVAQHGVKIQWNFFASCHGKGPSDQEET